MERMRSPNYPSVSLPQAIDLVAKIHKTCRSNVIAREVAVREMGYSGMTGRSMKVLSALLQFGLLEKTGKGDVKVTQRAVDILHGIEDEDRDEAMLEAAFMPPLFKSIQDRFPDGIPSENAIRSFLIKQEFLDAAIGPAINAFKETCRAVEHIRESDSHGDGGDEAAESTGQMIKPDDVTMQSAVSSPSPSPAAPTVVEAVGRASSRRDLVPNEVYLNFRGSREVLVEGLLDYDGILELEEKIKAVKMLLKKPVAAGPPPDEADVDDLLN